MTQVCGICNSPHRLEIDRLLVQNRSITSLSQRYGFSRDSLYRHRKNHLSRQLVQAQQSRDLFVSNNMLKLIEDLLNSSLSILKKTEKDPGKYGIALKAISESRKTVEFLFEVSINLKEIQLQEERQKHNELAGGYDLKLLSDDELETLSKLLMKATGKQPGRRTDLEKKRRLKANRDRFKAKRMAEQQKDVASPRPKRKLKRRKIQSKPENEFDQMRHKLGMSNDPEPTQQRSPW